MIERRSIHIPDVLADPEYQSSVGLQRGHVRTILAVPMLRENALIGAIAIWRTEVGRLSLISRSKSFSNSFADQGVIAIENVRLFKELQNSNRDLTEALEQQTATSEILRIIASSPTDIQPVLDIIVDNAARLCEATEVLALVASKARPLNLSISIWDNANSQPCRSDPLLVESPTVAVLFLIQHPIHVHDRKQKYGHPSSRMPKLGGRLRALVLCLPRRCCVRVVPIGSIVVRRTEVRPFTDKQIKLLETFADQAVIAIENVRLFQELKESLEQQTATSEILA